MTKHNQNGEINSVSLLLIVSLVLLVITLTFGIWAFSGRQDYKNNSDAKIAAAVTIAKQQQTTTDENAFNEANKSPLRTYNGPETFGSLVINYPKTWSGYVDDTGQNSNALVDGYWYPNIVPSITSQSSVFALRVQVLAQAYSDSLNTYQDQEQAGQLTAVAYALPKVPKTVGVELSGSFSDTQTGTMVILPLRDKTLEISTQGNQFLSDFNTYILPNFSFSP